MINIVFCSIIVIVSIWIGQTEKKFINNYRNQDFSIVRKSIQKLQECLNSKDDCIQVTKEEINIIKWLAQHFKGKSKSLAFKPEQRRNLDFILLVYPSSLSKPVPRSPVHFAPALLTTIGILGTFSGIFLGLQEIDLGNIGETQQLISASQNLLAGMKTAFVTSLFGMGAAIFFILYLSWGERRRIKIRNDLRKKLSDIAFLESSNSLLSSLDNGGNIEVAKTLQTVANNLSGLNADTIANAIKSAIASPQSPLVLELKQLRELQESQG